ncbi:hypothetical protein KAU51_00035 [Candidatus Parcubacteria bacterium]|nr:hypothetical protein [Candidatus Parcubacteria bacterium]
MTTYALSNLITPKRTLCLSFPKIGLRLFSKLFLLFSLISIISLLIFAIIQVNQITRESNLILTYQENIKELSQRNQDLEIKLFQNNSFESIELLAQNLNYEKVGKIYYIKILESTAIAK